MNIQIIHFTTNPLMFKHQSSSYQFHNIRLRHSNLVLIRMNKAWNFTPGCISFCSSSVTEFNMTQLCVTASGRDCHLRGLYIFKILTKVKLTDSEENDAFNLSWEIREVNENTQSLFRFFSEGSRGAKSSSLSSAELLRTGGTLRSRGLPASKGCGVNSGGSHTATI